MSHQRINNIQIEYQTYGESSGAPLLLVHGLGVQLIEWSTCLIDALVAAGFYVVVYDNRDAGLSSQFDSWGPADLGAAFQQARAGETVSAPYTLDDMADDGIGLLSALGIDRAHVLGLSNGGAIAQIMAIRHPSVVASLTSVMATSGRRGLPRPTAAAQAWLSRQRDSNESRESYIADALASAELLGSPGFPKDTDRVSAVAGLAYERMYYPAGSSRHLLASIASGDSRVVHLSNITCPTLVVHGAEDPLVPLAQGQDVADSIPGARLLVIDGMAHDLPDGAVAQIVPAIVELAN